MKEIPLTKGKVALVDDEDYPELSKYKWYYNNGYAERWRHIMMHNAILDVPPGLEVDHKDRNSLNNQRANLRLATHLQNQANKKKIVGKSSAYLGVYWNQGKWCAQVRRHGHNIHLGRFADEADAARAYNEMASQVFGEFANLNSVPLTT